MAPRKSKPAATLTLRIDPKLRKQLQKTADDRHMSESALAVMLIEEGIGKHDVPKRLDSIEDRLTDLEERADPENGAVIDVEDIERRISFLEGVHNENLDKLEAEAEGSDEQSAGEQEAASDGAEDDSAEAEDPDEA